MSRDSYNYGYGTGSGASSNSGGPGGCSGGAGGSNNENKDNDWGSWLAIFILFSTGIWFVALPWLFIKIFGSEGKNQKQKGAFPPLQVNETVKAAGARAAAAAKSGFEKAEKAAAAQNGVNKSGKTEKAAKAKNTAKKMTKSPKLKSSTATLLQLGGMAFMAVGFAGAMSFLGWADTGRLQDYLGNIFQWASFAVAGVGMLLAGGRIRRQLKRFPKYLAVMGERSAISLDEIVRKLGYGRQRVEKDLECMMDKGFFGPGAYINHELGYFIRSSQAEEEMAQKRAAKAGDQAETPKEAEAGYSGILRNIRRANDRIADPVLSEKIDKLENITARIFRAVEEDPKKLGRIDTFLNYYLPTTQKLLDSYAEFEAAGVEGENLRQAKERIEATMDSIIAGFAHQLDEIYRADAMDVDSDIRVMETMLHRDTASVEKDFGLGGGTATQTKNE